MKEIKMALIDPPASRIREEVEDNGIDELAESIKSIGLINPIQVKGVNGRYEIIAGERRFLACMKIGKGSIRADVLKEGGEKEEKIKIAENMMRKEINPIELGRALLKLNTKYGVSNKKIGGFLGKSSRWVQRKVSLLKLPKDLQGALRDKSIGEAVARELAKVGEREKRKDLLGCAIDNGATLRVVELWVKDWMLKGGPGREGMSNAWGTEEKEEGSYRSTGCLLCGGPGRIDEMRWEPCHKLCYYELMLEVEGRAKEERKKEKEKEGFKENEIETINRLCRKRGWNIVKRAVGESEELIEIRIKNKAAEVDAV